MNSSEINIFYSPKLALAYFSRLSVTIHKSISIMGFVLILTFSSQLFSGIMLAFSLIPECMLIPAVRDEEDSENHYIDDFF